MSKLKSVPESMHHPTPADKALPSSATEEGARHCVRSLILWNPVTYPRSLAEGRSFDDPPELSCARRGYDAHMPEPASPTTESDPRAAARRQKWILLGVFLALVLLSIVPLRMWGVMRLQDELAALRDRGEPTKWEDLIGPAPGPLNAANKYLEAFSRLDRTVLDSDHALLPLKGEKYTLPPNGEPLDDEVMDAIARFLERNADPIRLLREGDAIGPCSFVVEITPDRHLRIDNLDSFLASAELRSLEVMAATERGDVNEALAAITGVFRLAERVEGEPRTLIGRLVGVAIRSLGASQTERLLNRVALTDEQLARLIGTIPMAEPDALRQCFAVERVSGIEVFPRLFELKGGYGGYGVYGLFPDNARGKIMAVGYRLLGLDAVDELVYLQYMARMVEAAGKPLPDRARELERVESDALASFKGLRSIYTRGTQAWMPSLSRAAVLDIQHFADMDNMRAALAVERYRLVQGRLPDSLADLVPQFLEAVPEDPFTGGPLIYRKLEDGYIVYSLGADTTDNGGAKTNSAGRQYEPGSDIVLRIDR
jgi:hypothetical protein